MTDLHTLTRKQLERRVRTAEARLESLQRIQQFSHAALCNDSMNNARRRVLLQEIAEIVADAL